MKTIVKAHKRRLKSGKRINVRKYQRNSKTIKYYQKRNSKTNITILNELNDKEIFYSQTCDIIALASHNIFPDSDLYVVYETDEDGDEHLIHVLLGIDGYYVDNNGALLQNRTNAQDYGDEWGTWDPSTFKIVRVSGDRIRFEMGSNEKNVDKLTKFARNFIAEYKAHRK